MTWRMVSYSGSAVNSDRSSFCPLGHAAARFGPAFDCVFAAGAPERRCEPLAAGHHGRLAGILAYADHPVDEFLSGVVAEVVCHASCPFLLVGQTVPVAFRKQREAG